MHLLQNQTRNTTKLGNIHPEFPNEDQLKRLLNKDEQKPPGDCQEGQSHTRAGPAPTGGRSRCGGISPMVEEVGDGEGVEGRGCVVGVGEWEG